MINVDEKIAEFIESNIELIDSEDWETLLHNCVNTLSNSFIKPFIHYLEAAEINIDELSILRTQMLIMNIEKVLKALKPGRYKPSEFIHNIEKWVGYGGSDLFDFIYYNSSLWPNNIEILDNGYREGHRPYFIVKVS